MTRSCPTPVTVLAAMLISLLASVDARAQVHPAPTRINVAEGVFLFQTQPYGDAGLDGNSVVIVGDDGVLVFDSNGTPAAARAVLAEIRALTNKPIKYLVNSHWHWDHWYGAEVYKEAYPQVEIITHERTRALMAGPAILFNQPGLDAQLPQHIRAVEDQLQKARAASPSATGLEQLEQHLARDRSFLEQKRGVRHTLATRTFTDSLTIRLGQRVVQVLHHDRAITPGDAYLYLPNEKIVVLGDLLINPITFALFCYPSGWISTLDAIAALDASVLVPGHGSPMRDKALLEATRGLLVRERALARETRARGRTVEEARAAILADSSVLAWRSIITGGNSAQDGAFALYLVDWFVRRVYQEVDGTLDDSIPKLP